MEININYPLFDESIELDNINILTLESTKVFSDFVKNLYSFGEEDCKLKIFNNKSISLKESEIMIVTDVLGWDINSASIIKSIHNDIEKQLNDKPEVKAIIDKLSASITEIIAYECLENELDLEYDEITVLELIKALGVKVETKSDTIFERLFEIIQVFKYLNKKKLLVLVNISSYFSKNELEQIFEYIVLNNIKVLLVEPRKVIGFKQYVLDEDYFFSSQNVL